MYFYNKEVVQQCVDWINIIFGIVKKGYYVFLVLDLEFLFRVNVY